MAETEVKMICRNCKAEIKKGTYTCPNCGASLQLVPDFNELDEAISGSVRSSEEEQNQADEALDRARAGYRFQKYAQGPDSARSKTASYNQSDPDSKDAPSGQRNSRNSERTSSSGKAADGKKQHRKVLLIAGICLFLVVTVVSALLVRMRIRYQQDHSVDYQLQKANAAKSEKDYAAAAGYYTKALELDPENTDILFALAELYETSEDNDSAIRCYENVLKLDKNNSKAFSGLLAIYESQDDLDSILALKDRAATDKIRSLFSDYEISEPVFDPAEGSYNEYFDVTISADPGMEIYYCADGNDPASSGILYKEPIPLTEEGEYYIWAVCKNKKGMYSDAVSAEYYIELSAPDVPTVSPDGGDFVFHTEIYVSIPENCNVYYTWDGEDPDENSRKVDGMIELPVGNNILSVIAIDQDTGKKSSIYRSRFTYYPDEVIN